MGAMHAGTGSAVRVVVPVARGETTRGLRRGLHAVLCLVMVVAGAGPARGQNGESPVADAAKRQDGAALRALLRDGVDLDLPQGDGATALHWAAYRDDVETVRMLLGSGAAVDPANALGVTPLWLAANNGSPAVVEALLAAGADPNVALPSGEMPLMTASRTGSAGAVRALLAPTAPTPTRRSTRTGRPP